MKILCIHASAGAGHLKAAEAVYNGIRKATAHEVLLVDALDYSSGFFKRSYKQIYFFFISKIPGVWGLFFRLLDIPWLQPWVRWTRRLQNRLNTGPLHKFLQEQQFDYIIITHFMPAEVAAALKAEGRIASKLITAVTDFDVHRIWLAEGTDLYCVASEWTRAKLEGMGVSREAIAVTGIPTDEKFSAPVDISALKNKLGLTESLFTVLMATGSFGIGPIEEILRELKGFQVIVVCGHNEELYQRLKQETAPLVHVMGLVDNMHELMAASDVMVTKPGGLSISEALVSHLPMIFFNAIPGQETNNIKVLRTYGIGVSECDAGQIGKRLKQMRASMDDFLATKKKIRALARPSAVSDIISLLK